MSHVLQMLLMTVAVVWGVSAVAVVALFAVDERAFRRHSADDTVTDPARPVPTAAPAPARQLATSTAG